MSEARDIDRDYIPRMDGWADVFRMDGPPMFPSTNLLLRIFSLFSVLESYVSHPCARSPEDNMPLNASPPHVLALMT
jgi:hypothetical protein